MKKAILVVLLSLVTAASSFAQAGFGALSGVVSDPSHAVIPSASVALTGTNGERRITTTNASGYYEFTALPIGGGYTLVVSAPGFQGAKVSDISTSVGTTISQNVTLTVGSSEQTVEVTGANVEQVQTETSAVSQLIDSTVWQNSPLELRTQNAFIALVAGASPGFSGRGAAVSGARAGAGNFLVEGMDNNDQGQGGAGTTFGTGGAVTTISPDAIQEYRVITHNPSAEYGRAGGFSTDTSLKSGTNHFHGSLFEYNRVQALAANDWFSNHAGVKDSLIRNQFGGSIGGPIYRDKTFFFATVELHRLRQGFPLTGTATTQDFLNFVDSGAFETFQETDPAGVCIASGVGACPGAFNLSSHLGPVFKQLQAAEPHAFPVVAAGVTAGTTNVAAGLYTGGVVTYPVPVYGLTTVTQKIQTNQERGTFKLDHKIGNKDQLGASYLVDFETSVTPYGAGGTTFGPDEAQVGGSQLFTINETHTFSPTLLNVFRAGYTRHVSNFTAPGTDGVPSIVTANDPLAAGFGSSAALPQFFTDNEFLYEDSITKNLAKQTLKAGFRFVRTRNGSSFYNDVKGSLDPWDTETLLTDETFDDQADRAISGGPTYGSFYLASASVDSTTNAAPDVYRGYRANEFAAYFQDDYKASKNLTLNLGLRWEYFGPPHNFRSGIDSNVYFGAFAAPTPNGNPFLPTDSFTGAIQHATFIQKDSNIWNKDTNNFAPRVGFSVDPRGDGKLAIRGGFGIGFDRLYNNVYENIRFNTPHFSDNTIGALVNGVVAGPLEQPALTDIPFDANSLFAAYGGKPVPRHIDQRLVTAYYEQANFGFEYELAKGYVFETNYIGTFGRKLVGLRDANNFAGRTACSTLTAACKAAGYTAAFSAARPNLLFNSDNFRSNGFGSNYNGLQTSIRKGYSNGFMFLANYTYSRAFDVTSDVFTVKTAGTGITNPTDPAYDYGPADFDVKHLATITLNYEEQYRRRNLLLGGWAVSPIITLRSGTPFTAVDTSSSYNPIKDGRFVDRPVLAPNVTIKSAINHSVSPATGYIKPNTLVPYICPANVNQGLWCEPPMQRNAFYGPSFYNVDLGIQKHFYITEAQKVTFAASFFDLFNHPNFENPIADLNNTAQFGQSINTYGDNGGHRVTQLSLRYDF